MKLKELLMNADNELTDISGNLINAKSIGIPWIAVGTEEEVIKEACRKPDNESQVNAFLKGVLYPVSEISGDHLALGDYVIAVQYYQFKGKK